MKKIVSLILSMCMMISMLTSITVYATTADALIAVANGELHNTNGRKYGAGEGVGWCDWFIKWCANQAGIPDSVLPRLTGVAAFVKHGNFRRIGTYSPKRGDIVVLDFNLDGVGEHVEIVTGVHDQGVYTIGGNTSIESKSGVLGVEKKTRYNKKSWGQIIGYLEVKYAPVHYHTYTGYYNDSSHPHSEYRMCSCGDVSYTGNSGYSSSCTICNPPAKTVTIKVSFDANGGSGAPASESYTFDEDSFNNYITIPNKIPKRSGYEFVGWTASGKDDTIADFKPGNSYNIYYNVTFYAVWEKEEDDNTCGSNMTWKYYESSAKLKISGSGRMWNYSDKERPWEDIKYDVEKIVIGEGVRTIGDEAFKNFKYLKEVELSDSITDIGEDAFLNCRSVSVEYDGTEEEFNDIDIEDGNEILSDDIDFNYFTVIFRGYGSGEVYSKQKIKKNGKVKRPKDPVHPDDEWAFRCWNINGYYTEEGFDFNTKVTEDLLLMPSSRKLKSVDDGNTLTTGKKTLYAPDGRTISVSNSEVDAYVNVGWYTYPVTIVYAPDGRTENISKDALEKWQSVGWYTYPVTKVYAPGGRSEVIYKGAVSSWKSVGWYEEPVSVMYALDGRQLIVPVRLEETYSKLGWYYDPVTMLYSNDGRSMVVYNYMVDSYVKAGWHR